ncbi:DUF6493 family protein [Streptacidiphilus sp. PAMC 29251]
MAQCKAELLRLKGYRKEIRSEAWSRPTNELTALTLAGVACSSAPSAAAAWLSSRSLGGSDAWRHPALLTVVQSRPVEWQAAVVARLAERSPSAWWPGEFELLEYLVRTLGCPVPTSDGFVTEWQRARSWPERRPLPVGDTAPGDTLWLRLAQDSFAPLLAPRLFELPDIGDRLLHTREAGEADHGWPACLNRLAEQGVLDRSELIDACLARLVRGGRQGNQRAFLKLLLAFAPTVAENAAQVRSYLALLDAESSIAGHAQQVLTALDQAGLLADDLLVEASATVLFRSEKKLVRAQLTWLDRAVRQAPERADPLVLAASDAFGHPDAELQERALKLIDRHLGAAGEAILPELRSAAEALNPAHAALAVRILGGELPQAAAEACVELLPPVPQHRPVPEPLGSPAEVAEELGAILAGDGDVVAFERALDGLVRHCYRDRAALTEALEPFCRVHPWRSRVSWWDCTEQEIRYVAAAVSGQIPVRRVLTALQQYGPLSRRDDSPFGRVLAGRMEEAAWRCMTKPLPFLLATPTSSGGTLTAEALVQRLAEYESLGVAAGVADLSQALLRVVPTEDPDLLAAAERLGSKAGKRTARWLKSGGLPHQASLRMAAGPKQGAPAGRSGQQAVQRIVVELPGVHLDEPLGPDATRLLQHYAASPSGRPLVSWAAAPASRHWIAVLPRHREELAALLLDRFATAADAEGRGGPLLLPHLAEAEGPAGPAAHLAVGYGLGARFPEDRAAAVDALLVLAARGDLDGGRLGRELAELVRLGAVKPNRLTQSVRAAAETGAYRTVWSVLAGALPGLLADAPARGTAELLALAADCARRSESRGEIPAVTKAAEAPGAGRLAKEARALREVLAG